MGKSFQDTGTVLMDRKPHGRFWAMVRRNGKWITTAVCNFELDTGTGKYQCVVWGEKAESFYKQFKAGGRATVSGYHKTRQFIDKKGVLQDHHEIVVIEAIAS